MQSLVDETLMKAVSRNASDVHFTVGLPPQMRIDGEWGPYGDSKLSADQCEQIALVLLGRERMDRFRVRKDIDCSYSVGGVGRFRANVFLQRGSVGAAVRVLPYQVPGFDELGLPEKTMQRLCGEPNGIVLACGPTGSGKSTTLASMVSYINRTQTRHIVTIEDPIEFLHQHEMSIVEQREVGADTNTFADAMKYVLRQSPDVVLVGEIRDPESVRTALMIAETGHLVLSTLHCGEVAQGLSRLTDMFPGEQQREIRVSLSLVLRCMMAQQLLPGQKQRRRVLAYEMMLVNAAIRNLIREGKFQQVYTQLETRKDVGMRTMNASLAALLRQGEISRDTALARSPDIQELQTLMGHT